MDCLHKTVPQRGFVSLCEKSPIQTARQLCEPSTHCELAPLQDQRDRVGRV